MSKRVGGSLFGLFLAIITACSAGTQEHAPAISLPTGIPAPVAKIAYRVVENERGVFYLVDVMTKDEVRLTEPTESVGPYISFSPDGRRLVYVAASGSRSADLYVVNLDGTDRKRLTKTGALETEPVWSPDGEKIAYVSPHEDGVNKIFITKSNGKEVQRLTEERDITTAAPVWSPDGSKIACVSRPAVAPRDEISDIRVVEVETGRTLWRTSDGFHNYMPMWSPDDTRLGYISNKHGSHDIYTLNLTSQTEHKLTNLELDVLEAIWSPREDRIVFLIQAADRFEIGTVMGDGSNLRMLTATDANDVWASWSPDGRQIAFFSDRDGQAALYVMNADGSEQTRIPTKIVPLASSRPIWLPYLGAEAIVADSSLQVSPAPAPTPLPQVQRIAFVSGQDEGADIYVLDMSTRQVSRLTDDSVPDMWPRWSPDGSRLLFMCSEGDNWDLCLMNADGSELRKLTDTRNIREYFPVWSPSGYWVAYVEDVKEKMNDQFGLTFGLTVVDVDTRIRRQVLTQSVMSPPRNLFWMSGDSEIVYLIGDWEGQVTIQVTALKEGDTRVLFDGLPPFYRYALPLPDGTKLLYAAEDEGAHRLYIVDLETGELTAKVPLKNRIAGAGWSPDGREIAVATSLDEGESDIYILSSDGQNIQRLVDTSGEDFDPAWAPSGDQIAFTSMDGDRPDLWLVNADGSGLTKLVENVIRFEWSP